MAKLNFEFITFAPSSWDVDDRTAKFVIPGNVQGTNFCQKNIPGVATIAVPPRAHRFARRRGCKGVGMRTGYAMLTMHLTGRGGWGGVDARLEERTADGGDVVEGRRGRCGRARREG